MSWHSYKKIMWSPGKFFNALSNQETKEFISAMVSYREQRELSRPKKDYHEDWSEDYVKNLQLVVLLLRDLG